MRLCKFFNYLEGKKNQTTQSYPEAQVKVMLCWKTPFSKSFQPEKLLVYLFIFFKRGWREQHNENGESVS